MVAHIVRTNTFRGLRPLDPRRDIYGIARLLEEAFRPEHTFPLANVPPLREIGIWLWTLSYAPVFPPNLTGFVWVEENRIVGNVTITQDERRADLFMISNVAVKPEFRQRGIARQLMLAALNELRTRRAKTVLLNVRPNNPSAERLYANMGFHDLEMRGEWRLLGSRPLMPLHSTSAQIQSGEEQGGWRISSQVRPLRSSDYPAIAELLRAVVPTNVAPYRAAQNDFALPFDEQIIEWVTDRLTGQRSQRWAFLRNERLAAVMLVRGQWLLSPHRITVQVHPRFRGQIESELLTFALAHLQKFPATEIRASATDSHPEWITALEQRGFGFAHGLRLMAYTF